jgi:hypothetical protein
MRPTNFAYRSASSQEFLKMLGLMERRGASRGGQPRSITTYARECYSYV